MKSIREYIRNLSYDCSEARNEAGKAIGNFLFKYFVCHRNVRLGDTFIMRTEISSIHPPGSIVTVTQVKDGENGKIRFNGETLDPYFTALDRHHFKKVRRSSALGLKAIRDAAKIMKAVKEYGDDLRDIAKSHKEQYESTLQVGHMIQSRQVEEALRILSEYFPEVLK